jgi:hypothetical protein
VQANANGAGEGLKGALLDHKVILPLLMSCKRSFQMVLSTIKKPTRFP